MMFTLRRIELARRKERLIAQARRDRETLAAHGARLEWPFALADKAAAVGYYVKAHPWGAVVAATALGIVGRRQAWRAAGWSWALFKLWRTVGPWLRPSAK